MSTARDFGLGNTALSADTNAITINGGLITKRTATATDYTVLSTDYYIAVTNTAAPRAITLPLASALPSGTVFIISDESGLAATNNITITQATSLIDGSANVVINTNYGTATVISNGTTYFLTNTDWENNYDTLRLGDGTALLPSLAFSADTDTGIYRISADTIGFSTNGTVNTSGIFRINHVPAISGGQLLSTGLGSSSVPAFTFNSSSNTGLSASGTSLVFSTATLAALTVSNGQQLQALAGGGSASVPNWSFVGGAGFSNKGMYSSAVGVLDFSVAGSNELSLSSTAISTTNVMNGVQGTAGNAAYSFSGEVSTGMYQTATGQLQFSVSGTQALLINTNDQLVCLSGSSTVTTPSLSFSGDTQTGIYRAIAGTIGFTITGTEAVRIAANRRIRALDGTEAAPEYSFTGDADNGMWSPGIGQLAFSTAGLNAIEISASQNVGLGVTPKDNSVTVLANSARLETFRSLALAADSTGPKHNIKIETNIINTGTHNYVFDSVKSLVSYGKLVSAGSRTLTGEMSGFRSEIVHNGASGSTITNAIGFVSDITVGTSASNVITNAYGAMINDATGTGLVTNQYGIFVEPITGAGTANYGVSIGTASGGSVENYSLWVMGGVTKIEGGVIKNRRTVNGSADQTILLTDYYVGMIAAWTVTRTWTLPTVASAGAGRMYEFKDESGLASETVNLIIEGSGTETIDGQANVTLTKAYSSIRIICSGTAWHVITVNIGSALTLPVADGTISAPSIAFQNESDLGWYRPSSGILSLAQNGVRLCSILNDTNSGPTLIMGNLTTNQANFLYSKGTYTNGVVSTTHNASVQLNPEGRTSGFVVGASLISFTGSNSNTSQITLARSRGTAIGSYTSCVAGDDLGWIIFSSSVSSGTPGCYRATGIRGFVDTGATQPNEGAISLYTSGRLMKNATKTSMNPVMTFNSNGSVKFNSSMCGTATLVAGTVNVTFSNFNIVETPVIFASYGNNGGVNANTGSLAVSGISATNFTITSSNGADTGVVNWIVFYESINA